MSVGFYVVNKEFLEKLEDNFKYNAEVEREKFNEIPSRIFKTTIASGPILEEKCVRLSDAAA